MMNLEQGQPRQGYSRGGAHLGPGAPRPRPGGGGGGGDRSVYNIWGEDRASVISRPEAWHQDRWTFVSAPTMYTLQLK
jgi:hypothetical protein